MATRYFLEQPKALHEGKFAYIYIYICARAGLSNGSNLHIVIQLFLVLRDSQIRIFRFKHYSLRLDNWIFIFEMKKNLDIANVFLIKISIDQI